MAKQAFKDLADALVPSGGARIADLLRAFDPADPMTKADCDGDKVDLKPLLNDASRYVLLAEAGKLRRCMFLFSAGKKPQLGRP